MKRSQIQRRYYGVAILRTITRKFCGLFAIAMISSTLSAQTDSNSAALGGKVTDGGNGLPLEGVRVMVDGTGLETYTNRYGNYYFSSVPTGAQEIVFNYVGYGSMRESISINAGKTAELDLRFRNSERIIDLEPVVIKGFLVGTARAINQQRSADSLTSIVASDEMGRFPDQNAAESIQRIAGMSLYRDQGEGRYVVVRGLNYELNSVSLNGMKLASPEEGDRGIALDVIPADAISSVEVVKAITPDMDGEGVGGAVNIKTKSPFDYKGNHASFKAQGNYSALSGKMGQKFNGVYSTLFNEGTLGLLVSPTWQTRKFGSYNYENDGWSLEEAPDGTEHYLLEAVNFRDYVIERKRYGASIALEGLATDSLTWFIKGTYNRFKDTEQRFRTVIDFTEGELLSLDDSSASFDSLRRFRRDLRDRVKDQSIEAISAGFDFQDGAWTIDGKIGYSKGHEESPNETQYRFRRNEKDGEFNYALGNAYDLKITQTGGASITDPNSYELQRVEVTNDSGDEKENDLIINARYDLNGSTPAYLKFGTSFRGKKKNQEAEVIEYSDGPGDFTFANFVGEVSDYPYYHVPRIDLNKIRSAFVGNENSFEGERAFEDSELDDWESTEDVLAAYIMGSIRLGDTNIMGGVRVERTKFQTIGQKVDLENEVVLGTEKTSNNYTNWLPGLHLRHELSENIVLRASYSNSLARPGFKDSAARIGINDDDEEVFQGNPNLKALESTNWDASVEYYLPSLGVLSAGVFYKDIKNFSYEIAIDGGYTLLPDYELTTFRNGSDGNIQGLELAYQQQLSMLPAPFDGIGILANITLTSSEANYPTRQGEKLDFIGNSEQVVNLAITYEKAGFFTRLAMNYRSERLREDEAFGGDPFEDTWVDSQTQLDLSMSYKISSNWEVFGEWVNITNEPFKVFFKSPNGQANRLGQFEEYDWSANFGFRWKL